MKRIFSMFSALTASMLLCAAGQAQVVISQVYGGGGNSGAVLTHDFVELFNKGNAPVNIGGHFIQRASAAGTFANNASQMSAAIPANTILQPGQYFLVRCAPGAGGTQALPTADFDALGLTLGATNGKIALATSNVIVVNAASANVVDFVAYGTGATPFEGSGSTAGWTGNVTAAFRKTGGCTETNDNLNDFELAPPSPRNTSCISVCGGAGLPDLVTSVTDSGCTIALNDPYQLVATVTNNGASAPGTTVSVVVPTNHTFTSATSTTGTPSYNAGTRTVSVNLGTLGSGGASGALTVNTTISAVGGFTFKANATTTGTECTVGNNAASKSSATVDPANPLAVVGVASASVGTSVFENIGGIDFERRIISFSRLFRSGNGTKFVFRGDTDITPTSDNTCIFVGEISGGGSVTYSLVARENFTTPDAANPTWKILTGSFNNLLSINDSGDYVFTCQLTDGATTPIITNALVKGRVGVPGYTVIKQGDAVPAGLGIVGATTWTNLQSASVQNDGTVSFLGTMAGVATANNAAYVKNNGNTLIAQKGVFIPGGQTGTPVAMSAFDSDATNDGRGLRVSADGAHYLLTGALNTGLTTNDNVVVVDGNIAVQEGVVLIGSTFTDPAAWGATPSTTSLPWSQMETDGVFVTHGLNAAGFNQGQDWISRNSVLLAQTGGAIHTGSTETWADNILARTFFTAVSNGSDTVVGGVTNRSTSVPDESTDGVMVLNGAAVVARENQSVDLNGSIRYVNIISDNLGFIGANRKLYFVATLRDSDDVCNGTFTGLPSAIVAVNLPTVGNPCPADVGVQGGGPGQDGQLNNDDFVAFINLFFAQDPQADVGVQGGGPGSDNQWNNDDFVAFINLFFAGCGN